MRLESHTTRDGRTALVLDLEFRDGKRVRVGKAMMLGKSNAKGEVVLPNGIRVRS